LKPITKARAHL